ncbi:MAG: hypothetical protein KDC39_12150 [Actinobacteria bacterium]|nr:hypothetical protein [Actinomycetota bacterium]
MLAGRVLIVMAALLGAVLVGASGCQDNSSTATQFTQPLNEFIANANTISQADTSNSSSVQSAIDEALPKMKSDLESMEQAQAQLTDQAAEVAGTINSLAQQAVNQLQEIQKAIQKKNTQQAQQAVSNFTESAKQIQEQINVWNNEVASVED